MQRRHLDPFNLKPLVLTDAKLVNVGQVTSTDFFDTTTKEFDNAGLFSIPIFGRVGTKERKRKFGWIDLRLPVFNPTGFIALTQLRRLNIGIMSGKVYARWDPKLRDFVEADVLTGQTGFSFFAEHWEKIDFERTASAVRDDRIEVLKRFKKEMMITRVPVMPAGLRELQVGDDGRTTSDVINDIYRKMISAANTVPANLTPDVADLMDNTRWRLQVAVNEMYDYFESNTKGKKKFFLGRFINRRTHDSTRNVISSYISKQTRLGGPGTTNIMDNVVGLYQGFAMIRPAAIFQLKQLFIEPCFISQAVPVRLTNRRTLEQEEVDPPAHVYDDWMTNEGLMRQIGYFDTISIRHDPVTIAGHYLALIYKGEINGKLVYKLFHDIRELPKGFNRRDVYPVSFAEMLFLTLDKIIGDYPSLNTRYPIDNFGSIQPNRIYLKSTVDTERRYELDENWELVPESHLAAEYPIPGKSFHDTSSPHLFRLAAQNGDFDGDTNSSTALQTENARNELKNFIMDKRSLIGPDGQFKFSASIPPVELFLYNFTGEPRA